MNLAFLNEPFFLFLFVCLMILLVWNILLQWQIWQTRKKLKVFFAGKKAADLEGVLFESIKRLKKSESDIKNLFQTSEFLRKMAEQSIQKVGLVRFNPFKDTGGDQSFSIALLDSQDNGLVISNLYTPQGTRIYAKPIINGQSVKYNLSKEELLAIKEAQKEK